MEGERKIKVENLGIVKKRLRRAKIGLEEKQGNKAEWAR